ncbi:MAG: GTP 3',8-cyclase MoaA [Deltaproteobacteria bacterium]|nr:GTP 3',8-cyclase MoaA [Deltaproteobacteria bacterium]
MDYRPTSGPCGGPGIPDAHGRRASYLRVSVTDRCNLRCAYCTPAASFCPKPHQEILTYEEILAVVTQAVAMGVRKVRLTGGEPLVRRGLETLVEKIAALPGLLDLCLTTNGVLLADRAKALADAGLKRINVSLDSLDAETFARITGRDALDSVLSGLEAAEAAGLSPTKINVVPLAGINAREAPDFARLTLEKPVAVRFIELMPVGPAASRNRVAGVDTQTIRRAVEDALGPLSPIPGHDLLDGPAERFALAGAKGEVGFITPVTGHPCPSCNRLRLTADGKLRPCLLSDAETDIRSVLRSGGSERDIQQALAAAVAAKPAAGPRNQGVLSGCARVMHSIGG